MVAHEQTAPLAADMNVAPLERRWLRAAWKPLRVLLGWGFVVFTSGSTIFGGRSDAQPLLDRLVNDGLLTPDGWDLLAIGVLLGVLAALIVFVGELIAAEYEAWGWYVAFLIPDVRYTWRWLDYIFGAFGSGWGPYLLGLTSAIAVAFLGEHLLFGKRRRGWLRRLVLLQWGRGRERGPLPYETSPGAA